MAYALSTAGRYFVSSNRRPNNVSIVRSPDQLSILFGQTLRQYQSILGHLYRHHSCRHGLHNLMPNDDTIDGNADRSRSSNYDFNEQAGAFSERFQLPTTMPKDQSRGEETTGLSDWKTRPPYLIHESNENFPSKYEAACHCERVKYQLSRAEPLDSKFCHCTTCQTQHGTNLLSSPSA